MDCKPAPQIVEHVCHPVLYTPFAVSWIRNSPRFVVGGQYPKATGALKVYELQQGKLAEVHNVDLKQGVKCGRMFDASTLATGDFQGTLTLWDLTKAAPKWSHKAHDKIVNAVDCSGGCLGPNEIVTASRDGCVRLFDPRTSEPVVSLEPPSDGAVDAWSVALGNSFSEADRSIACGYDNGDVKLFDLRTMRLVFEENVKNGVTHLEFDRKDIAMNKLHASCLEGKLLTFDLRTYHPTAGFARVTTGLGNKATVWQTRTLPQNREISACFSGGGDLTVHKYMYPTQRRVKDAENPNLEMGVAGSMEILNERAGLAQQPVVACDWHPEKCGLLAMGALDQSLRVAIVTKLNEY